MYCSRKCRIKSRTTRITLRCDNLSCSRSFDRLQKEFVKSFAHYCSRSCAVKINNKKFPKITAQTKPCVVCETLFSGKNKCCSSQCRKVLLRSLVIPKERILSLVHRFYRRYERIPTKNEFYHSKAARGLFGTWNKAIEASGFTPNPAMVASKHVAKDGHKCDSLSERIIDDWLFRKKIIHEIHVPYNKDNMSADFKIGQVLVEFIGLEGAELWKERGAFGRSKGSR